METRRWLDCQSRPCWQRMAFVLSVTLIYVVAFVPLQRSLGSGVSALSMVPVAAAGWAFGVRGGLAASGLALVLNLILFEAISGTSWLAALEQGGMAGFVTLVLIGVVVGRLSDLGQRWRGELAERKRAEVELTTLYELARGISSAVKLPDLLQRVYEGCRQLLPVDTFYLALYDPAEGVVEAPVYIEHGENLGPVSFPLDEAGLAGHIVRTGESVLLGNTEARQDSLPAEPQIVGAEQHDVSYLGVPLTHKDQVIGVLSVQYFEPGVYGQAELQILARLGGQVAVALDNARLFERTQRALERAQALSHVNRSLIMLESLSETLQTVVDSVATSLPADRAMLIIFDTEQEELTHFVTGGPGADQLVPVPYDELMEGLSGWVLREREPALSPKGQPEPREGLKAQHRRAETGSGAVIVVPLHYRGEMLGTLTAINRPEERNFTQQDVELMTAMANQAAIAIENARLFDKIRELASTDHLTGLYNRRGFFRLGRREIQRARRFSRPLTAMMIDLDRFKDVNDTQGHAAGDEVLAQLATFWRQTLRDVDLLGRYAGDEFVALLSETDLVTAQQVAERLRQSTQKRALQANGASIRVTTSIGVASLDSTSADLETLLQRADEALYAAKQAGRNRVSVWQNEQQ